MPLAKEKLDQLKLHRPAAAPRASRTVPVVIVVLLVVLAVAAWGGGSARGRSKSRQSRRAYSIPEMAPPHC
ncbi:MAG: hypothetical protein ACREIA_11505 [Opitutaceae bacterium]